MPLMFGMPGGWELVILFLIVLLVFGAKRIPEIAQGLGKGIKEFKNATRDLNKEIDSAVNQPDDSSSSSASTSEEANSQPTGSQPSSS
jgi:sec-independent protein translocase protein TatA